MHPLLEKYFDPKSALIGAVMMSVIVWFVNSGHGVWPATTAALKQAAYTFLMSGVIARLCRYLASRPWPAVFSLGAGVIVPSLIATGATYFVHSLKGTPEPVWSTVPVVVLSVPLFALWSWQLRKTHQLNSTTVLSAEK